MQGAHQQHFAPAMSSAELWDAVQQQQAPQHGGGQYGGAPALLHGGHGLPPLPSFELPPGAGGQPLVLPGKPLSLSGGYQGFGQQAAQQGGMGGVSGVPSSLTSLPGVPYASTPSPPPGAGAQPQLYGASGSPQLVAPGGYPQLSGLSSQLSGGVMLGGGGGLVPTSSALPPLGRPGAGGGMLHGGLPVPMPLPIHTQPLVKLDPEDPHNPSSSHSVVALPLAMPGSPASDDEDGGDGDGDGSPTDCMGSGGLNKSRYRGVSYDRKKAKWRVQIKVAALGKSGVSVGYFDTEEAAARAYDRAAIGLLGRDNPNLQTNFDARDYTGETIPPLTGKTREEVKTTLKSERIKQAPRRRFTSRQRTSRFMGVGSSNRKNQWQARILVHGKVTHLGYYETEEEAAKVYDKVSLALHGDNAQTNFPPANYAPAEVAVYAGLDRENLQRALGVKPMDKSSRFRGVSKKKGKWEAKVMVNRRWAYRELFDSEEEAARAYDRALWRLKPKEAHSYVNFKDDVPPEVAHLLGEEGGGGGGGGGRGGRARGGALASTDEEEASEASDGMSDDGSGGAPAAPAWTQRTSRSGRRLRATGSSPAAGAGATRRAGSAPDLQAAAAQAQQHMQAATAAAAAAAAAAAPPPDAGFVALPGGGLQLQFGAPPPSAAAMFSQAQAAAQQQPQLLGGAPGMAGGALGAQPLLVRVGSETHLIPHQQQQRGGAAAPGGGAGGDSGGGGAAASALGKRMNRIQSEPAFAYKDEGAGDLSDLMNDRDLFRAFDLSEDAPGGVGGGGMGVPLGAMGGSLGAPPGEPLELDTGDLLDFIRDMPDAPPPLAGGGAGRGGAGMFKSRSMGNLADLSGSFFDEEDNALAAMEYARPRKISKSMSVGQLAGLQEGGAGAGTGAGRPPLPPGGGSAADKLGPLGKPIRRTNTFSSSLAVLQEADREGRGADDNHLGQSMGSHHSSGDDLVTRLLAPAGNTAAEDDAMLADLLHA